MKEKASKAYMEQVWSERGGPSHGYQERCRAVRVRGNTRLRRTGNTVRTHRSGCKHATALPVLRHLHIHLSQPGFFGLPPSTYYLPLCPLGSSSCLCICSSFIWIQYLSNEDPSELIRLPGSPFITCLFLIHRYMFSLGNVAQIRI